MGEKIHGGGNSNLEKSHAKELIKAEAEDIWG
jgi:hypothetical protein